MDDEEVGMEGDGGKLGDPEQGGNNMARGKVGGGNGEGRVVARGGGWKTQGGIIRINVMVYCADGMYVTGKRLVEDPGATDEAGGGAVDAKGGDI